jgi:hypothetical protein
MRIWDFLCLTAGLILGEVIWQATHGLGTLLPGCR